MLIRYHLTITISQNSFTGHTIPSQTLAIIPTTFNRTPKPNCYYNFTGMPSKSEQNVFIVPVLNIFSTKLPVHLLCTIINSSPNDVILPKNWHISEMKSLSYTNDLWHPPSVNEVTHDINPNNNGTNWTLDNCPPTSCETHNNS